MKFGGGLSSYLFDESFPAKHSLTMIPVTVPNDSDDLEFGGYNLQKVWWFQILNTIRCARTCYLTDLFDKNAQRSCLCKVNLSTNIPINAMLVPPIQQNQRSCGAKPNETVRIFRNTIQSKEPLKAKQHYPGVRMKEVKTA